MGQFLGLFNGVDSGGTKKQTARRDLLVVKLIDNFAALVGMAVRTTAEVAGASGSGAVPRTGDEKVEVRKRVEGVEVKSSKVYKRKSFLSSVEVLVGYVL